MEITGGNQPKSGLMLELTEREKFSCFQEDVFV